MVTATAEATWVVHRAGPMTAEGVQSCTRCKLVLLDRSGAALADDRPVAAQGWYRGTPVARMDGDAVVCVPWTGALLDDMAPCTAPGGSR